MVEWDVEVIGKPFSHPEWGISASEPAAIAAEWKGFCHAIVNLTIPLAGGVCGFRYRGWLHLIMSFTSGVLIAVCCFHILPDLLALATEHHLEIIPPLVALVLGFLSIHTREKVAPIHAA